MNGSHVLVAEGKWFSRRAMEMLTAAGFVVTLADLSRDELRHALPSANVLWVRLRTLIDADVLACAGDLRYIVTATTGLNHIDEDAARQRGIAILSLRGETEFLKNVRATAEHTIALMLALMRQVPAACQHVTRGGWQRDPFRGCEISGKTVGIVGLGRIGRMVEALVSAFGAKVLVNDPRVHFGAAGNGTRSVTLPHLLEQSDIVTIHVNLCERTAGFFGAREFEAIKPGAWLVNTSRGELLDETALLEALVSGRLAGAALDVLAGEATEGMATHPLVRYARRHENLLITPHIGGCTRESMEITEHFLAGRLCEVFRPAKSREVGAAALGVGA